MEKTYPYELTPLSYEYDALEPYMDAETVRVHHQKHAQTYTDNLNKALADLPQFHSWPLEKILEHLDEIPEASRIAVRNNAGGVYNHDLFFGSMTPNGKPLSGGELAKAIEETFETVESFSAKLKKAALDVFGSGWAWLVLCEKEGLKIQTTANQESVLHLGVRPLLLVDVWEHAYYLKYQNKRADYLENWLGIVDWETVERRYREHPKKDR